MSNGNNNQQLDIRGLKQLTDSLYQVRNAVIDNNLDSDTREKYNRLQNIVATLYQTDSYADLVNILKAYDDKTYLPNTIGEYMFACIDLDPNRVGCIPVCSRSILPNNAQYKPCKWPVYKVDNMGAIEKEANGTNGDTETAIVISATGNLPPGAATVLKNNNVRVVHVYREYPNRFVSTIDLSNSNPIPQPGAELGKKGKDSGKGLKKSGGKSSWWSIVAMVLGGIFLLSALWYVFGGKKNNKNGAINGNGNGARVETVRGPSYNMNRPYTVRGNSLFC